MGVAAEISDKLSLTRSRLRFSPFIFIRPALSQEPGPGKQFVCLR
jgi:hypothetical protein